MYNTVWFRRGEFKPLLCFNKPLFYFNNTPTIQKPLFLLDIIKWINHNACLRSRDNQHTLLTTLLKGSNEYIKSIYSMNNDYTWLVYNSLIEAINAIYNSYWVNGQRVKILTCIDSNPATFAPISGKTNLLDLNVIGLDPDLIPNIRQYLSSITNNISLIILNHMSDVVGLLIPVRLYAYVKYPNTVLIIDGTQAASHSNIDIRSTNCDAYLISSNKIYASLNICLCFIKPIILTNLNLLTLDYKGIHKSSLNQFNYVLNTIPITYEPYSSKALDIIGLTEILKWKQEFNLNHGKHICRYLWYELSLLKAVVLVGNWNPNSRIFCFKIKNIPSYMVVAYLNKSLIYGQSGHHCSMSLIDYPEIGMVCRISIGLYNTFKDADVLLCNIMQLCYLNEFKEASWIKMLTLHRIINKGWSQFHPTITNGQLMSSWTGRFNQQLQQHSCDKCKHQIDALITPAFIEEEYTPLKLLVACYLNSLIFNNPSTHNCIFNSRISIYTNDLSRIREIIESSYSKSWYKNKRMSWQFTNYIKGLTRFIKNIRRSLGSYLPMEIGMNHVFVKLWRRVMIGGLVKNPPKKKEGFREIKKRLQQRLIAILASMHLLYN
ncbi:Cysteine desulfurase [Candidatus Hodgkinia cicadicola]|uniref:Cysteine desulfurase n=1 Tax=Candidatus Hodgkinia cicadicola TaxID=573658 RepID=A0ABX4MI69_9HYPH|nr:Cysteine desulfurase [Candidatus Hodgkinia cicadicola]